MSTLQLRSVAKRFAGISALEDMSLTLEPGEIFSLTGPSAAGKTTTCRLISGIERPSEGEILFDGDLWNRVPAKEREVAYMFESYALYPQLNVFDNVAFPLRAPQRRGRLNESEIARSVRAMLELVEMQALEQRLPAELSGGQKQRVALCRALVQEPSVYLLDEPISHLDAKLRHKLRGEIRRRQLSKTVPTLWATPDAMEAISVSDRIAVILDGRIRQIGSSR
ncbi:MAG: ABC transporter ATP-binding protein, partial [Acidiferrobacterales bacterium]|nr:ABC transporter ATP-binding protein [Acidiferrobacterales bacterium]